ncbi:MAG: transposase [Leptolyngbyaceae cyanobacterium]
MEHPPLHRQLQKQLRQWVNPKDQRHLQGYAEAIAAILQSSSACLGKWLPYLGHRNCQARAHMERLSYLVHNPHISAERFYNRLLQQALQAFEGSSVTLTLDTSMLWDQFCLVEVCLVWGGRSFTLAQTVLEHASATVAFEDYQPVLLAAKNVLPPGSQVTLLADRGFEHAELLRLLSRIGWDWAIRVKSDLNVTLATGLACSVGHLFPPVHQAYLLRTVTVLENIQCHLATAHVELAKEPWAVLSSLPPSVKTFALYGQRFGGIEPHFKDYKSAAFHVLNTGLRDATALTCLFMLLDSAYLIALIVGMSLVQRGLRSRLDWHGQRGLSFLQLGLREIARLSYERLCLPTLGALPSKSPPKAYASQRKRRALEQRIEFNKVIRFSW